MYVYTCTCVYICMCIHVYICVNIHIDEICMFICRFDNFERKSFGSTLFDHTPGNKLQHTAIYSKPVQHTQICSTFYPRPHIDCHWHTQAWLKKHSHIDTYDTDRQTDRNMSHQLIKIISTQTQRSKCLQCAGPVKHAPAVCMYVSGIMIEQPYIVTLFTYIQIHNLSYIYRLSLIYLHVFAFTCTSSCSMCATTHSHLRHDACITFVQNPQS